MSTHIPDSEKDGQSIPPYSVGPGLHNDLNIEQETDNGEIGHGLQSPATRSSMSIANEEKAADGHHIPSWISQASTLQAEQAVAVERSKRRGLFGRLTLLAEVEEPKNYPRKTKWFITFVVAVAAMAAPMGSSIFYPALSGVAKGLNTSPTIANLSVALYMLSMSVFPLWWSSFSEIFGRRTIYLTSFTLFVLWSALCAVSTSIEMLIVMRMLSGGAAASVQAVGAGTIADVWEPRERGKAMGIFYLGPLCGPLFAPVFGGVIAQRWGWRSTQWFLAIYGTVTLLLLLFWLPETLITAKSPPQETETEVPSGRTMSRVSSRQVVEKTAKWLKYIKMIFVDPLNIILYLRFPAVFLTVYYASMTFGSLYVLNISIQDTFGKSPYDYSTLIVGLLYVPNALGYILASTFGGRWMDVIMQREAKKANRIGEDGKFIYRPEDRMRENAWLGAFLYPAALIWYGWTVEYGVFWFVPMIACFIFGVGSMLIFSMSTTMLTEFMPQKSSTGVAVNNFVRNLFSCAAGVVTAPIISGIGNGWLFTILGVVSFASSAVIWAMRRFGPRWRDSMDAKMA